MLPILFLALFAAIIPTSLYVLLIWWLDQYEREPGALLLTAFLWGALPAIFIALVVELALRLPLGLLLTPAGADTVGTVIVSPLIEEVAKAGALLGLYLLFRSEIDDVLDGMVYGALIGAGFAMTENFFYFISAGMDGGLQNMVFTVLLRSLVFGLSHALYTGITGIGIGLAASHPRQRLRWLYPPLALLLAILVHFFHNLSLTATAQFPPMFLLTIMVNWGGVLTLLAIAALALRNEKRWIKKYLATEVPEVLSPQHYQLVQSRWQRFGRVAGWLRGANAQEVQKQAKLHHTAMELTFLKLRLQRCRPEQRPKLLPKLEHLRAELKRLDRELNQIETV
ncbi:MAG: PrsW family intramembrane metalloprotease [Chloroflexi bacterium]|nr:PrsW family intramembrane metalloprotease [Chloroflexota bacterium]